MFFRKRKEMNSFDNNNARTSGLTYAGVTQSNLPGLNTSRSFVDPIDRSDSFVKQCELLDHRSIVSLGDFCKLKSCPKCKKEHLGFVQSIRKRTQTWFQIELRLLAKCTNGESTNPYSIVESSFIVKRIGFLSEDSYPKLNDGDIALCYIPAIHNFVYGQVKNALERYSTLKVLALPQREKPSAAWNTEDLVVYGEDRTIIVLNSLCNFAFRCAPCETNDVCEIFFFNHGIRKGIVKQIENHRYIVQAFEKSFPAKSELKRYTPIQDGEVKGELYVSKCVVKKADNLQIEDSNNASTSQEHYNDVEMVDLAVDQGTCIDEDRKHPLVGKLCWIDDSYFDCKSCMFDEHFGSVFTVLRDLGDVLAGVELIEPCMECASATDGTFKKTLYLEQPRVKSCLFLPVNFLNPVDFAEVDNQELGSYDLCQVFIPQTKTIELGYYVDQVNGRARINILNSQVADEISNEKSFYLDREVVKPGQTHLRVEVHKKLVRFVFRGGKVSENSHCEVYVPNHSIFDGFVVKKEEQFCSVLFTDGVINEALLKIDSTRFYNEENSMFRIRNFFLRRKIVSSDKNMSCEDQSKSDERVEFEDHEKEPCLKSEYCNSTAKPTTFNARSLEFPRSLPPNPESNSNVPAPSYESLKPNGIHIKPGDFCYIEEGYMTLFCEKKNHYGTVVAIISTKKGGATACVKLIERCHCKTIGDGTYDGKLWLEKPLRERCLFVPVAKVQVIEFQKHSSGALFEAPKVKDVCDVFIPSLKRKFPAIVTKILEPESFVEVQMMDEMIRFTPNYDQHVDGLQKCILRNGFVYYQLRESFVRSLFSPSEVRVWTICRLFAPGQGVFQCLVDSLHENYRAQVTLLEGDIDRNEIKGLDDTFFQKIGGMSFIVSRNFLLSLADTDNDFGPDFVVVAKSESGDESFEPTTLSRDNTPRAARQYAVQQVHIGKKKGIQGHHNSCYMDSLFYSLFLFSDALDSLCKIDLCKNVDIRNSSAFEMQNNLLTLIVNPLRGENCFVPAGNVMRLRKQLETFLPGVSKEEKDAEELLAVLFSKNFVGGDGHPPLLHLRNVMLEEDQDLFVYQVFVEPENEEAYAKMQKSIPCVQNILAQSFVLQGQFFRQNPTCFLIQLPRFGKEKVFPGIFLPNEIDISNISLSSPQKCSICSDAAAKLRCKSCSLSRSERVMGARENFSIIQYCEQCFDVIHKSRKNHVKDEIPTGEQSLNGFKYILDSVICIKTSHYVSFARTKLNSPDGKMTWLFFDSMADRVENRRFMDSNVPEVRECPTIEGHLKHLSGFKSETERLDYVERHALQDEMLKRLVQDAYIGVYRHKQDTMETEV